MYEDTIEIEVCGSEMKEHIGFLLVDEGRSLRMRGEEEAALVLETTGRELIEEARGVYNSEEEQNNFEDSLYNV